jgi:hypothetical protein
MAVAMAQSIFTGSSLDQPVNHFRGCTGIGIDERKWPKCVLVTWWSILISSGA